MTFRKRSKGQFAKAVEVPLRRYAEAGSTTAAPRRHGCCSHLLSRSLTEPLRLPISSSSGSILPSSSGSACTLPGRNRPPETTSSPAAILGGFLSAPHYSSQIVPRDILSASPAT